ncbi:MAG: hypothetical protein LC777_20420 [Actinobacteria bacterium]|nr:hypothetical protein [Actinomycetota bacterium]
MPTDVPIACTLTVTQMPERLAQFRALGDDALLSSNSTESCEAMLRFRRSPQVRERLEALIAAESECCAFLRFDLIDEPDVLLLKLAAPEGGEPVIQELVSAFRGEDAASR